MKAKEIALFEFLNGTKQFVIPIYQRTYSWNYAQCQQLWKDIERLATNTAIKGHFIGSVVYVEDDEYNKSVVPQLLVIDGQQRLTTLSLLIAALAKAIDERTHEKVEITSKKLFNYYLRNNDEDGDRHYKLLLTQTDKQALIDVVNSNDFHANASQRIKDNYAYFLERVRETPNLQTIFEGLKRLIVVEISLERDKDNPQLIFESLNSTGLKLTQADLIRNYILMGKSYDQQAYLYNEYWYPMESRLDKYENKKLFDHFIRNFLTIKNRIVPKEDQLYEQFKIFYQNIHNEIGENILIEMKRYSEYYIDILKHKNKHKDIIHILSSLSQLDTQSYYPFLMECLYDYDDDMISYEDLHKSFVYTESFIFRRQASYIGKQSLRQIFAQLMKQIKLDRSHTHYDKKLKTWLRADHTTREFPSDIQFLINIRNTFIEIDYIYYKLRYYCEKNGINTEEAWEQYKSLRKEHIETYGFPKELKEKYPIFISACLQIWPYPSKD